MCFDKRGMIASFGDRALLLREFIWNYCENFSMGFFINSLQIVVEFRVSGHRNLLKNKITIFYNEKVVSVLSFL